MIGFFNKNFLVCVKNSYAFMLYIFVFRRLAFEYPLILVYGRLVEFFFLIFIHYFSIFDLLLLYTTFIIFYFNFTLKNNKNSL